MSPLAVAGPLMTEMGKLTLLYQGLLASRLRELSYLGNFDPQSRRHSQSRGGLSLPNSIILEPVRKKEGRIVWIAHLIFSRASTITP